jgi:Domain of unknown function (DUF4157)/Xanthomonas XOO_2897-like deaminase
MKAGLRFRPSRPTSRLTPEPLAGGHAPTRAATEPVWPAWVQRCGVDSPCDCHPGRGRSSDAREQEADRTAEGIVTAQTRPEIGALSSRPPSSPTALHTTGPAPSAALVERMGPGRPLPDEDRAYFESRLGADLADVQVHTGDASHRAADSLHASAFTVGSHVGFRAGRFAPGTTEGQKLLAHELTHVLQQRRGAKEKGPQTRLQVDQPADAHEQEANRVADQVMSTPATTLAHEISHVIPERPGVGVGVIQRQVGQREAGRNILRHRGRWTEIDSPAVLGLWAKEAAINKLWTGPNVRAVQEAPEKLPELVEAVLPKLQAALYSSAEFTGSPEARKDADEALRMRWPLINEPVVEEFVRRYTNKFAQALAHTPEGCDLVTRPEEFIRIRHHPYGQSHATGYGDFLHKGDIRGPREILDIEGCHLEIENCGKGDTRFIWFILRRDPSWIYVSYPNRDPFNWRVSGAAQQVAESTQFAAEFFPHLLKLGGFGLGLSSRLALILTSEILSALGEQGVRSARGENMQSAIDILKGIGFGVVVAHFTGHLFGESPGRDLVVELDTATMKAARKARAEVARTDASLVERELRAGKARAVDDADLAADGYRMEVDVVSEGQPHIWRQKAEGNWCRFTTRPELCVGQITAAVGEAADVAIVRLRQAEKALAKAKALAESGAKPPKEVFGAGKSLLRPVRAQALRAANQIDERLLDWAIAARSDLINAGVAWGKSNVVTAIVNVDGRMVPIILDNPEWALHAEGALMTEVRRLGEFPRVQVQQVFSERIPCGPGYANCMNNITRAFPTADIFYGVTGPMTENSTTQALWVMYGLITGKPPPNLP